jgi:DNA-binding CsgD family transcriptional regulator
LVTEEERGRELIYEVTHPLIQEAIYQAIGGARRRAIHRLVARALAATGQRAAAASHYVRCAEIGEAEAVDALIDALRQAEERQSHREAMPNLGALIDLLPGGDPRWLRVLDGMDWDAEWVIDHQADLFSAIGVRAMQEIERVVPPPDLLRQAVVQLRRTSFAQWDLAQCAQAIASAQRSRTLFLEAGEPSRALAPLHELSWAQSIDGDLRAQEETARRVIAEAETSGDRVILNHALGSLAWSLFRRGGFAEAEVALRRSAEIARSDGRHYRHAWSLSSLAYCVAGQGRIEEALPLLKESRAASPAYADTVLFGITAYVQLLAGNFAAGLASWSESAAWNEGRLSARRAWGMVWAALSAPELGRVEEGVRYLAQARRIFGEWAGMGFGANCDWLAGTIARARGDLLSSLSALQTAARRLQGYGVLPDAALVLADLAEVAGELHDAPTAREAAGQLQAIARVLGCPPYPGLADLVGALAALEGQQPAEAAVLAERAVGAFAPTAMHGFHGRALDIWGRALAERNREAAAKALGEAAEIFLGCGAVRRRERAVDALARLGMAGRRLAPGTDGRLRLTAREREVVRLAVDGLTAREIGFRLFIGERTVETHLANAYAKLGVDSRLDLVRKAAELSI